MSEPKIKLWDLETGYNLVTVFSLYQNYPIPYTAIEQERYIICGSFRDFGKKAIRSVSVADFPTAFKKDPTNDYHVVKAIHEELSDADVTIAHNGDNFDVKYFNTRCLFHGLPPVPPIITIDTYKIAKRKFKFNSNRLDYLAQFLGVGAKKKIDGKVWLNCLHGVKSAVQEMAKYNRQDVDVLEKVYTKLAPYDVAKLNMNLFSDGEVVCPLCGSAHIEGRGYRQTRTYLYHRMQCYDCRHWFQLRTAERSTRAEAK